MHASLLIRDVFVANPEDAATPDRKDVVVVDGRIAAICAGRTASVDATQVIDGRDRLLLPGLINAHTHSPLNILKGTGDVLSHPAFMWRNQADTAGRTPDAVRDESRHPLSDRDGAQVVHGSALPQRDADRGRHFQRLVDRHAAPETGLAALLAACRRAKCLG